ncbi:MAG: PAS domain S-box protein, partial [Solirubrobacteraceae bacterium]|nr:PAS domain S-box protein [Solirubrobacteraceae bacterium]
WQSKLYPATMNAEAEWRDRLDRVQRADRSIEFDDAVELHGHPVIVRTELSVIHEPGTEELLGYVATAVSVDATRRAQALAREQQERVRESEAQFRAMAEALPQMTWIVRGPGEYDYFAPAWEEFTGHSREDLLEHGVNRFIHPEDEDVAARFRSEPDGADGPLVLRMRRHDGVYRWMEARLAAVKDGDGHERWFGFTLDITDRFEQEREARMKQEQLRATLELTGFGTYVWLIPENRFSRDTQLEEILGVPMEEMMTGNAFDLFFSIVHAEDRERAQQSVLGALVPGGPDYRADFRIHRPGDGGMEERWVSAMGVVEFDEKDEPLRLVGIFADITDRRLEDDGRLRLQKMEAIGTLASGIAHDFNNVIGAILSYARVAEAEIKAGASPEASVAEIARGAHRAGDIVRRLLTFSRDVEPRRIAFDLPAVVEEAETLLRPTLPSAVSIQSDFRADLPSAVGDPTEIHQLVVNLVTNAGHALGASGGTIELRVELEHVAAVTSGITSALDEGEYLRLTVADDGPGMTAAIASRIFDPFFTTKTESDGTGLGLAAAQSIVKNHGGSIAVETSPGQGARFTVHLPAQAVGAETQLEPTGPLPDLPETVRVLFVDDEQALVRLAYRAMPYHGCEVTGFTDPREAIEAFEQDPSAFDALVTDYSMPGLTGLDLTERIKAIRPELPVVLTSGYMNNEAHAEADRRGVGVVVPKPCSIDTLAAEVMRLLAR